MSVHSQADTEEAELNLERTELKEDNKGEHKELMAIYVARGLDPSLAKQVAEQLMRHDALGAHARDELGISETFRARPIQAALASAGSFAVGAAMPLIATAMAPATGLIPIVSGTSLVFLALLGGLAARAGGAGVTMGAIRVTFWGAMAMALTAGIGAAGGNSCVSGANRGSARLRRFAKPDSGMVRSAAATSFGSGVRVPRRLPPPQLVLAT